VRTPARAAQRFASSAQRDFPQRAPHVRIAPAQMTFV
jgi:hypothetical protein